MGGPAVSGLSSTWWSREAKSSSSTSGTRSCSSEGTCDSAWQTGVQNNITFPQSHQRSFWNKTYSDNSETCRHQMRLVLQKHLHSIAMKKRGFFYIYITTLAEPSDMIEQLHIDTMYPSFCKCTEQTANCTHVVNQWKPRDLNHEDFSTLHVDHLLLSMLWAILHVV